MLLSSDGKQLRWKIHHHPKLNDFNSVADLSDSLTCKIIIYLFTYIVQLKNNGVCVGMCVVKTIPHTFLIEFQIRKHYLTIYHLDLVQGF